MGIDIHDETKIWFDEYIRINKPVFKGYYASVIIEATDEEITDFYYRLMRLNAEGVDLYLIDEIEEDD